MHSCACEAQHSISIGTTKRGYQLLDWSVSDNMTAHKSSSSKGKSPKAKGRSRKLSTFEEGSIVMAKDRGRLYEARIVRVFDYKGTAKYFVHYLGWAPKYDRWMEREMLTTKKEVEVAEAAALERRQEEMREQAEKEEAAGEREVGGKDSEDGSNEGKNAKTNKDKHKVKGRSRILGISADVLEGPQVGVDAIDDTTLHERRLAEKVKQRALCGQHLYDDSNASSQLKLTFPLKVKKSAVSEWTLLHQTPQRLLPLPRPCTVEMVIADFLAMKGEKADADQLAGYVSLMESLKHYFNSALPVSLLYQVERAQYSDLGEWDLASGARTPAQVYGAEHLMRLLVTIPTLMMGVLVGQSELAQMQARVNELIKFIEREKTSKYLNPMAYEMVGMTEESSD